VPASLDAPAATAQLRRELRGEHPDSRVQGLLEPESAAQSEVAEEHVTGSLLRGWILNDTVVTMNASSALSAQAPSSPPAHGGWLLFIHQIPPKPDYFRVKVRRRLQRIGAVPLKNSVYLLPAREETMEDFQWLLREVRTEGGEATLCRADILDGASDGEVEALFRAERQADYAAIQRDAAALGGEGPDDANLGRLRRRMEETARIDFFGAPGRDAAERAIERAAARPGAAGADVEGRPRGRTWVTRPGVGVDRMASAWLIRRFIDPDARFAFAPAAEAGAMSGVLRFDMYEGEFTHEGDRCTFEVLLDRFRLDEPALRAVADLVHDIDCKEDRYARPETPGIAAIVDGIRRSGTDDAARLDQGAFVFEGLYRGFAGRER
jgi:hypothetical protein